ncbi:hypothetical protein Sjap_023644 [Stephania japonica]|uniref:Cytochrome c oxidase copper chaperone n=1 Tax=Stephania japonica TaxID=461633 RepID=A0AAP0EGQ0_9MAGN
MGQGMSSTEVEAPKYTGLQESQETPKIAAPSPNSKPKKICCACPHTKKLRDECIVENGEDACAKWIQAHLLCLRAEGFNV